MKNPQVTQDTFMVIERLAALAATEGVSQENKDFANKNIKKLLDSVVAVAITDLTMSNSGLIS